MINDREPLKLKVIRVRQPIGEFYIASISAEKLAQISYADVRRMEERDVEKYLGVQRPLDESRVKKLKQYVGNVDATFPTSVILAIDERCAEFNSDTNILTLSEVINEPNPITYDKIAKILDGQHRVASFITENEYGQKQFSMGENKDFEINVSIFIGADISQQATIFSIVNLAQTKVNRSLAYDLFELSKYPGPEKIAHKVAVLLDKKEEGPFYHRIKRLGVKTVGRNTEEPLTQAVFVESLLKLISPNPSRDRDILARDRKLEKAGIHELVKFPFRNMFIDGNSDDIAIILYEYFSTIRNFWPNSWDNLKNDGNILPKSNAFRSFMRYLQDIYSDENNLEKILTQNDFKKYFKKDSLEDGNITSEQFLPGSGGESSLLRHLRDNNPMKK